MLGAFVSIEIFRILFFGAQDMTDCEFQKKFKSYKLKKLYLQALVNIFP
jgi:hypothetical protein